MSEWIETKVSLPEIGEKVLVFGSHGGMYTARYEKEGWWKPGVKDHYCNPTYWMPLPERPERKRKRHE